MKALSYSFVHYNNTIGAMYDSMNTDMIIYDLLCTFGDFYVFKRLFVQLKCVNHTVA